MELQDRVEQLETQNAFLEKTLSDLDNVITKMNSEMFLLHKEVHHLRNQVAQFSNPDFIQERLHNGENR